ncbi:MAG: ACT domain-containing protein [Candidatus Wildermuthbacteria bacterium]|nr:ACT domain-containing protein [Candidatus Wildermuthbacteria bacterium]
MNTNPRDYFRNGEIYAWKEIFAVAKTKKPLHEAFAVVQDKNEVTVIIDQAKLGAEKENIIELDTGWKIITFDMILPLNMVGWLAALSGALAEEGISILIVSAYSTDHVLVKEPDLAKALAKLQSLGCRVTEK